MDLGGDIVRQIDQRAPAGDRIITRLAPFSRAAPERTGSVWDYGPLGVELKNNVKRVWWRDSVQNRADMVGLDASILMHPRVWQASGHLDHFTDPMVDCRALFAVGHSRSC